MGNMPQNRQDIRVIGATNIHEGRFASTDFFNPSRSLIHGSFELISPNLGPMKIPRNFPFAHSCEFFYSGMS